jgi:hypothetical protein
MVCKPLTCKTLEDGVDGFDRAAVDRQAHQLVTTAKPLRTLSAADTKSQR